MNIWTLFACFSNSIISIQRSLCYFSRPVVCHGTKQNLIIAFTPLQLLVHCPFLAAPQLFHHRPCNPITILHGIQSAPGTKLALGSACWFTVGTVKFPCSTCCSGVNAAFIFQIAQRCTFSSFTCIENICGRPTLSCLLGRLSEWRLSIKVSQGSLNNAKWSCLDRSMLKADIPYLIQMCVLLGLGMAR